MRAGDLRHRLQFQEKADAPDVAGQSVALPGDFCTVWGEVVPLSGRELMQAQQVHAEVTHQARIRYRTGINAKQSFLYGGRKFEILAAMNTGERNKELLLMAVERPA